VGNDPEASTGRAISLRFPFMPDAILLTIEDLSDYLKVPVKTIYNWRSAKNGPRAIRVGRSLRFRMSDVQAWLDENADAA